MFADLTNAVDRGWEVTPSSSPGNYYQRRIGAGLFTEWGVMSTYTGANFKSYSYPSSGYYLTNEGSEGNRVVVNPSNGQLRNFNTLSDVYGVCVSP